MGGGEYIVIEGDEYDTAFFDKDAKFLHYDPYVAVLTSVEYDHADIFKDIRHIKGTFAKFISPISQENLLIAFDDDENIAELLEERPCTIHRYGKKKESAWRHTS